MIFGNIIVQVLLTYYLVYIITLLYKDNRTSIIENNNKLDELRTIPVKSLDQQKEFLDRKYPKREKFIWNEFKRKIPYIMIMICLYAFVFYFWSFMFSWAGISLKVWQGVLSVIILSLVINIILEKFGVEKDTLLRFFRNKKKKVK